MITIYCIRRHRKAEINGVDDFLYYVFLVFLASIADLIAAMTTLYFI